MGRYLLNIKLKWEIFKISICQQLKHLYLFQMQSSGRACLQRQTIGWDSDSDTHDIRKIQSNELSRVFDIHFNQDVLHAQPKLKWITSLINEQHDSQVSRLQRDPRREPAIISAIKILRSQMNSQEFTAP